MMMMVTHCYLMGYTMMYGTMVHLLPIFPGGRRQETSMWSITITNGLKREITIQTVQEAIAGLMVQVQTDPGIEVCSKIF